MEQMNNKDSFFKPRRLKYFDYSSSGAYFLTICVKNRKNIFWESYNGNGDYVLSANGKIADVAIQNISDLYKNVSIERYVIMPDHIHILLVIHNPPDDERRAMHAATVSKIIQQLKGFITKQIGYSVWQKSFHDHVVRNEYDFQEICHYIDLNPIRKIGKYCCSGEHCSPEKQIQGKDII